MYRSWAGCGIARPFRKLCNSSLRAPPPVPNPGVGFAFVSMFCGMPIHAIPYSSRRRSFRSATEAGLPAADVPSVMNGGGL